MLCAALAVALCWPTLVVGSCELPDRSQPITVDHVVDGDTLRLADGRLLRLTGINTPELGRDGKPDQPLASAAKRQLASLIDGGEPRFVASTSRRDRYGRLLGAVFVDGAHVGEHLLRAGMGWHVVVPPDTAFVDCLVAAEAAARKTQRGVWQPRRYPLRATRTLQRDDAGFLRLRGRVTRVANSRHSWWVELDHRVSLRLDHDDLSYFDVLSPKQWQGKTLVVRGWLIWRGHSKKRYPPWMMHLRHPAMLEAGTS